MMVAGGFVGARSLSRAWVLPPRELSSLSRNPVKCSVIAEVETPLCRKQDPKSVILEATFKINLKVFALPLYQAPKS